MTNDELTIKNQSFMSLANFNVSDGFSEELAGLDSGFDRIKIPAGSGTMFEVPRDNPNEPDAVKEFSAVILHHHAMFGTPGGMCINCTNNKFGSGENGSKACKNKHQMYLLRENEIFPVILPLPTSSNKEFSKYIKRLLSKGKKQAMWLLSFRSRNFY